MLNNKFIKIVLGAFLLSAFIFAGVEEELKKINQKLDNINSRLSNLEKKVSASPGNNNKKQAQADPNKVYNIPTDENTVVLGNPNAKVTITKFTDFQ
jgi:protein-disulfide isomerase|tara:strand:- start:1350 stop:1640 length:291 start_codon:yes stop_codon:yes gene_type:complete